MMIELPLNTERGSVYQLLALKTIRRIEPDRNWTLITLDNQEQILVTKDYRTISSLIKNLID
jgi:hypothetical protein